MCSSALILATTLTTGATKGYAPWTPCLLLPLPFVRGRLEALGLVFIAAICYITIWSDNWTLAGKISATFALTCVALFVAAGPILRRLPSQIANVAFSIYSPIRDIIVNPIFYIIVILGLSVAAYATSLRYLIFVLAALAIVVGLPRAVFETRLQAPTQPPPHGSHNAPVGSPITAASAVRSLEGSFDRTGGGLSLRHGGSKWNALLILNDFSNTSDFILSAEAFLEPGSLLNVLYRFDPNSRSGYMARLDSRADESGTRADRLNDGFLTIKNGTWYNLELGTSNTALRRWVGFTLAVSGPTFQLIIENASITCSDTTFATGAIGFFNELGNVSIRNITIL